MLTYLEVLDTAVKIGLGGLVGGYFSILLAKTTYRQKRITDKLEHKREILIGIAENFERSREMMSGFLSSINMAGAINTPNEYNKLKRNLISATLKAGHALTMSRMIGFANLSDTLTNYGDILREFKKHFNEKNNGSADKINKTIRAIDDADTAVHSSLNKAYDDLYSEN